MTVSSKKHMKKLHLITLILIQTLIISCERQNTSTTDQIIIGNPENLSIYSHDTVIAGYYPVSAFFEIDLDLDGNVDFKLKSFIDKNYPNWIPGAYIACLHLDASFYTIKVHDTIYFTGHDTTTQSESNTTIIRYRDSYKCRNSHENAPMLSINELDKVKEVAIGEKIKETDYFTTDTLIFSEPYYNDVYTILYQSSDTVIYNVNSIYCTKHRIPKNQVVYIGLKVKNKLGWIRMSVLSSYKLVIFETAIQI